MLLGFVALGATGCSDPRSATVSGKVSYKGTMLKGGNVTFLSTEGKGTASTQIGEDGNYTLEKAPVGAVKICVETQSLNPKGRVRTPKYAPPPGMEAPGGYTPPDPTKDAKRYVPIPDKYAEADTTTLTYTVIKGPQTKDIELVE
jgi:hypothetical protein